MNASPESKHWLPGVLTPEKTLRPVPATGWSAMEEEMTRFQRMTDLWDSAPGGALVARTYIYIYTYIVTYGAPIGIFLAPHFAACKSSIIEQNRRQQLYLLNPYESL